MPAPRRPWTEDTELRELHAAGHTLGDIAKRLDRSRSTISHHAKRLGLVWDRAGTRTAAATAAKIADARTRRAQLAAALLDDAERLRAQMWAPTIVFNFGGKDNDYNQRELPEPPHGDKLKIMQAVGIAVDRVLKIDLHDADAELEQAVGMLDQIAAAINAAASTLPDQDDR